ncbi:hypothetical protein H5410_003198 [Solanum commersonii]|uniref:Uncharacterized protein n=1 Tax=Solanum commersonii TaxID=4109 RepID=A0A9J6B450_SOLCO|nr:hypothetical protein H5410_003198 [Solanum commersonii]
MADLVKLDMVEFYFPNEPVIEWRSSSAVPKVHFISYLKSKKLISKSVPVMSEFPYHLPGVTPKREIDFSIDILPDTRPMSIPPYRIALNELKKLKT